MTEVSKPKKRSWVPAGKKYPCIFKPKNDRINYSTWGPVVKRYDLHPNIFYIVARDGSGFAFRENLIDKLPDHLRSKKLYCIGNYYYIPTDEMENIFMENEWLRKLFGEALALD